MYKKDTIYRKVTGGMKRMLCVMAVGVTVAFVGNPVYAANAKPMEVVTETEATTEELKEEQSGKLVKENENYYYKNANGKKVKSKFVTIGKKTYYFGKNGTMVKGWMKKGKKYYYFNRKTGVQKKKGKVDGISIRKDGTAVANKESVKKIEVMIEAKKIVSKQTKATDTKSEKLKKVFNWVMKHPYKRYRILAQVRTKKNWEIDYVNDIFKKGNGCCVSESSAFAYLAKECGYSKVYICDDTAHAWVEIDGKVYDTLFAETKGYDKYFKSTYKVAKLHCANKLKI